MMSHKSETKSNACFLIYGDHYYVAYFSLADIGFYHMIPIYNHPGHYEEEMWDLMDVIQNMPNCTAYISSREKSAYKWG